MSYEAAIRGGLGWHTLPYNLPLGVLLQVNKKVRARVVTGSKPVVVGVACGRQGLWLTVGRVFSPTSALLA